MADSDGFESADEDAGEEVELPEKEDSGVSQEEAVAEEPSAVPDTSLAEPVEEDKPPAVEDKPPVEDKAPVEEDKAPTPPNAADDWGWGGWSSWAATSVSSVAHMATKTSKGISGALETFEASLGLPTPEELAKEMKEEQEKEAQEKGAEVKTAEPTAAETQPEEAGSSAAGESIPGGYYPGAGLWSGLSSLSVTGTQFLNSGLETLEKVSNQAYEALNDQSTEVNQTKQRVKDSSKGTNLMAVLQEAKVKYEQQEKVSADTKRTMSYLFDEKQGLSQLEALQMLSRECVHKMKNNTSDSNTLFLYIETSLELKSGDSEIIIEHLGAAVTDCLKTLKIDLPIVKLNQCRYEIAQRLAEMDMSSVDETAKPSDIKSVAIVDNSLNSIASFAARSVELFKKIAELSLLKSTLEVDMKTQADTIKFLNEVLCCELDNIREQFEAKMEDKGDRDLLFVETSNAVSYVQETLYFFVPILKWIIVKTG